MAIYTVGRGRVILALILTSVLLLTLDLRGNPVIDRIRDGFDRAMSPVEQAAEVVTNPAKRAWNSYDNYDNLERDNEVLNQLLESQIGADAAARAAIIDYNRLLALSNLPSLAGIPTEKAQVIGSASNNIDQIVEINKGSNDGIAVGMPVVNDAGLIGKITQVNATSSQVMLVTDPRFAVPVEVLAGTGAADSGDPTVDGSITETVPAGTTPLDVLGPGPSLPQAGDPIDPSLVPVDSIPASSVVVDTENLDDLVPPTSGPDGELTPPSTGPDGESVPPNSDPDGLPVPTTTTATTIPANTVGIEKEFGTVVGRGQGRPLQTKYLQNVPSLATFEIGDLVETAGGSESLAPANIPVGRVINVAERDGVTGPLLEIAPHADLDDLNFVQVVLYRSPTGLPEQ
jgi:rod shape-determining protein MreC